MIWSVRVYHGVMLVSCFGSCTGCNSPLSHAVLMRVRHYFAGRPTCKIPNETLVRKNNQTRAGWSPSGAGAGVRRQRVCVSRHLAPRRRQQRTCTRVGLHYIAAPSVWPGRRAVSVNADVRVMHQRHVQHWSAAAGTSEPSVSGSELLGCVWRRRDSQPRFNSIIIRAVVCRLPERDSEADQVVTDQEIWRRVWVWLRNVVHRPEGSQQLVPVPEDRLQSGRLWRCRRPLSRAAERQSGRDTAEQVSAANARIGGFAECGRTSLGVWSFPGDVNA